jgi:SPOR domain
MRHLATTRRGAILTGFALAIFLAADGAALAQTGPGSYAAPFLKIPVGARLMTSPDAVAGMQPDASLMFSNPAFMTGVPAAQAFISTSQWLDDLTFSAAGVALPIGNGSTVVGLGSTLLYSGGLKGYDDAMAIVSEQSYYNVGLDMVVSHRFSTGLSAAVGATALREHIYPYDGTGYAFHVGASYWLGRTLLHGAARDLGGSVSYDGADRWTIAPEWMAGAGRVFDSAVGQFYAGGQVARSDAYGTRLQIGVDYQLNTMFALRTGVTNNTDSAQPQTPFNAGFGVHYGAFAVEYAYTPQEYFSSTHTFTLSYAFGRNMPATGPVAVPVGDLAPPVPEPQPVMPAPTRAAPRPAAATTFVLVGGSHSWLESARSEVRALELLKISSKIEQVAGHYRVVIGRYGTYDEANQARQRYKSAGHIFDIVAE